MSGEEALTEIALSLMGLVKGRPDGEATGFEALTMAIAGGGGMGDSLAAAVREGLGDVASAIRYHADTTAGASSD